MNKKQWLFIGIGLIIVIAVVTGLLLKGQGNTESSGQARQSERQKQSADSVENEKDSNETQNADTDQNSDEEKQSKDSDTSQTENAGQNQTGQAQAESGIYNENGSSAANNKEDLGSNTGGDSKKDFDGNSGTVTDKDESEKETEGWRDDGQNDNQELEPGNNPTQITEQYQIPGKDLQIVKLESYDGFFLEDGSDESVTGILGMTIKNTSNETLEYGNILLTDENGEEVSFVVTMLLPGATAIVAESSRREFSGTGIYYYKNAEISFNGESAADTTKLELDAYSGALGIRSASDTSYDTVIVYYKYKENDGVYKGGITYRVEFSNVKGSFVYEKALHYQKDRSEIVRVDYY